jgi:hypothetical protein
MTFLHGPQIVNIPRGRLTDVAGDYNASSHSVAGIVLESREMSNVGRSRISAPNNVNIRTLNVGGQGGSNLLVCF